MPGRVARLDVALLRHSLLDDLALLAGLLAASRGGGRSDLAADLAASRGRRPVTHPWHWAEAHRGTLLRRRRSLDAEAAARWGSARAHCAQSATLKGAWGRRGHWGCCAHAAAAGPRRAVARPGRAGPGRRCAPDGVRPPAALPLAPRSAARSARLATGEG